MRETTVSVQTTELGPVGFLRWTYHLAPPPERPQGLVCAFPWPFSFLVLRNYNHCLSFVNKILSLFRARILWDFFPTLTEYSAQGLACRPLITSWQRGNWQGHGMPRGPQSCLVTGFAQRPRGDLCPGRMVGLKDLLNIFFLTTM